MSHSVSPAKSRRSALLSAPLELSLILSTLAPVTTTRADDATPAAPAGQVPATAAPAAKSIDPKTVVARINGKDITRQDAIDLTTNLRRKLKANLKMDF